MPQDCIVAVTCRVNEHQVKINTDVLGADRRHLRGQAVSGTVRREDYL